MKQPTKVQSDSYVRTFDSNNIYYDERESREYNLFFLHARKKEIGVIIKQNKYETLNNVCRRLGLREFVNGNYIGWSNGDDPVFDIIPVNPEDEACAEFKIAFTNLTLLNMKEILGEN